jgi:hypothetical protein
MPQNEHYLKLIETVLDSAHLDGQPESIFVIDQDGYLVYVNAAWHQFARKNGGQPAIGDRWSLGANYFAAIPPPLDTFYRDLIRQAPAYGEGSAPLSHCYECSAPSVYREYNMLVYALPNQRGHLIVNSRVVERPHDPQTHASSRPERESYLDANGFLHQCAHCRRVEHQHDESRWDWVPEWVEAPLANISHGICPVCMEYYFPEVAES